MYKVAIIGASGYTGAQLVQLVQQHPSLALAGTYVSENSADAGKNIGALHGNLAHVDATLTPISNEILVALTSQVDFIFLATPHEASHDWMPTLSSGRAKVLDLSGAFRLKDTAVFEQFYGFAHTQKYSLDVSVYGLAEWHEDKIANASVIAVPGCYPTASLTALKPLAANGLLDANVRPVINAVSGVSGAGRKASLTTSFFEVSLHAYGVLGHRHTPEIEAYLGTPVIFTPHLGNFKRGILATITVKLAPNVSQSQLDAVYQDAYNGKPIVRLRDSFPKIDDVAHTPFVDLHWKLDEASGYAVVTAAIDNVMKGAASQAIQCLNIMTKQPVETGLVL
ncbi:N-acetyl-gamma-glutamyl-phosphate reductase [Alteromonas australica]|jgi:N-acetyl-gamma-glutamyl-phosphate reductase|uniref:N-acetyl-gamma-glutamyl-phosphate reductase n=1 Tax=Alteromonas TaxID=226 RepID=UPI0005C3E3B9|nr:MULTISPECIES: N-acetyl-gamma-glutamyl-phosphate reductase [Alteromonas]AJP42729.1 N-acetyl-gamma-glutamyl-phosphate reductase [Alteromonas australica]MAO28713.1 N-acetyl-gamma-glutamyl-phosphate reductase [Alteromonas sp.]QPL49660.1 N-acetyl-gamma-glutamyl-phosphate reductase [Alteromonas sp. B31-7]HBF71879.1 N-acetyl-gamma-glutamyl-phosphate reductase [Alteromonas australica]|tara:strand:- start:1487 stop:2500 length:1014 start_codon:yes stop_codon:yes gene_type:complete